MQAVGISCPSLASAFGGGGGQAGLGMCGDTPQIELHMVADRFQEPIKLFWCLWSLR
jgi:hypothetical protein